MFSTGVFITLLSAREIIAAHRGGCALGFFARQRYTRRLRANVRTLERLVLAFYDNRSFAVFMERTAPWRLAPAINAVVAGHSDPPWAVRWRYWLFLLVCRLQRVRAIVPEVRFGVLPSPRNARAGRETARTMPAVETETAAGAVH